MRSQTETRVAPLQASHDNASFEGSIARIKADDFSRERHGVCNWLAYLFAATLALSGSVSALSQLQPGWL
jgi:hypothetical protein